MDITNQDRLAALMVLFGALRATATALTSQRDSSTPPASTERVAATTALDIELARCKALGHEGGTDAACLAARRIVRNRFFEYGELRHGLAINPASETSGQEGGPSRLRGDLTGTRHSPSTPRPDSPLSSANVEGQPQ